MRPYRRERISKSSSSSEDVINRLRRLLAADEPGRELAVQEFVCQSEGIFRQLILNDKNGLQSAIKLLDHACILLPSYGVFLNQYFVGSLISCGHQSAALKHLRERIAFDDRDWWSLETHDEIVNSVVPVWHFAMLNDRRRNRAFFESIQRAAVAGHKSALDIGAGSGILSVFAAVTGSISQCYCCESSSVLAETCREVLAMNGVADSVHVLEMDSKSIRIGSSIPEKVSLVITEIFDCAVFGEGLIPTLRHAWEELLRDPYPKDLSPRAQVIPFGVTIYGILVESEHLRRQHHLLYTPPGLNPSQLVQHLSMPDSKEPYDAEHWTRLPGRKLYLSEPFTILQTAFDLESLQGLTGRSWAVDPVLVTTPGRLDAVMVFFVLHLDNLTHVSTQPECGSCWPQAIYPVRFYHDLAAGESVPVSCHLDERWMNICVLVHEPVDDLTTKMGTMAVTNCNRPSGGFPGGSEYLYRLNCTELWLKYSESFKALKAWGERVERAAVLIDGPSWLPFVLGRVFPDVKHVDIVNMNENCMDDFLASCLSGCMEPRRFHTPSVEEFLQLSLNGECEEIGPSPLEIDLLVVEVVEVSGLLKQRIIEYTQLIRTMRNVRIILPTLVEVVGCCIECQEISSLHEVPPANTLNVDVSRFSTFAQVLTIKQLQMSTLPHRLLNTPQSLLRVDLHSPARPPFIENTDFEITHEGLFSGILFWFKIHLTNNIVIDYSDDQMGSSQAVRIPHRILPSATMVPAGTVVSVVSVLENSYFHLHPR